MNQPDTFVAHDGRTYQGPPPDGWRQAQDGRWYPLETQPAPSQYAPPRPPRRSWIVPAAGALALLAIAGAAVFFLLGRGEGGEPSTPELFEETAQQIQAVGCDAEVDFRGELVFYIDRLEDPSCVFRLMTTAEDFGIDLPDFVESDDPTALLGTFQGPEYVVESDIDRDGVSFAFRER